MYHSPLTTLIIPSFIPFEHEFLCTQFHTNKCAIRPGFTHAFPPIIGFKHNHWHLFALIIGWSVKKKFWYYGLWGRDPIEPTHVGRVVYPMTKPWQVVDIWDCQPSNQVRLNWGGGWEAGPKLLKLWPHYIYLCSFPTRLIVLQKKKKKIKKLKWD